MSNRTVKAMNGAITGLFQHSISIITQIVIAPLILILAGQEALGSYAIVMQIVGYGVFVDFGISSAFTRYLCQARGNLSDNKFFITTLLTGRNMLYLTNFLFCILLLSISTNIDIFLSESSEIISQIQISILMMAIWVFIRTPLYIYNTALTATQDLATINIIVIFTNLIKLIASIFFVYNGFGLVGLIMANILGEFCQFMTQKLIFKRKYRELNFVFSSGDKNLGIKLARFGLSYWPVSISAVLLLGSDNIIAATLYGAATASIYYSTKMIGSMAIQLMALIINNIYPALNELVGLGNSDSVRKVYLRLIRYVLLLLAPGVLSIVIFSEGLINIWVGAEQFAGLTMTLSVGLFVFVQVLCHMHGLVILATGKIKYWGLISIIFGLISIISGYMFGKYLGFEWIIFGISLAMIPLLCFLISRALSSIGLNLKIVIKEVFPPTFFSILPLVLFVWITDMYKLSETLSNIFINLIIYALVFIVTTYIFGINKLEKNHIHARLNFIFKGSK